MKALYTFLLGCFCVGVTLAQSDIASVEYFFDQDPGIGNGTSIDIDPDVEDLNQNFSISTTGLTQGTHRLFVRVINVDGSASMYTNKTFNILQAANTNTTDIVEAEYFFDQDPGIGNGTIIDVTDVENLNQNFSISTSGLSAGAHRLFLRVKNADGKWSIYDNKTFNISQPAMFNTTDIVEAEYFFDQDPGIGNGTIIDVTDVENLNQNFSISTSGLSAGTHRLFLRVKNADGKWSIYDNKTFNISQPAFFNNADIVEAEYFFDQDPGIGNGTNIDVTDVASLNENFSISTTGLSAGTHRLFLRVKNANGKWSIYDNKTFSIAQPAFFNNADIVEAEYFFNQDPGVGNATNIDVTDVADLDENLSIATTGLPQGNHRLFLRVKNADGKWSIYDDKTFSISQPAFFNNADIVEAEYFLNEDPGVGNATNIDVTDVASLNEDFAISTNAIPLGTHRLFMRVKNADNKWSLYANKTVRVFESPFFNNASITDAEYFIDVDPGIGNATAISISGDSLDENLVIPTANNISQGDHYLFIRVKNADDSWSLYARELFTIDGTLGVQSETLSEIKLYPNPVSSNLNIKLPNTVILEKATLYDINGREVLQQNSNLQTIDMSALSQGTYLLLLQTDNGSLSKRIIKN